jgi:hypothetical protein
MPENIIERARERKLAAEQALQRLQEQVEQTRQQIAEWEAFIAKAESLVGNAPLHEPAPEKEPESPSQNGSGPVQVKAGSLVARAAAILLARGPLALKTLVAELQAQGVGAGVSGFQTNLNTALWRRRQDLFEKKEGIYYLRTPNFVIVET